MISKAMLKVCSIKDNPKSLSASFRRGITCLLVTHLTFILFFYYSNSPQKNYKVSIDAIDHPTNISHLVFGIFGSEKAFHRRRVYIESWWFPNTTRGHISLDEAPKGNLLPWSCTLPRYRVSDNFYKLYVGLKRLQRVPRIVHGIMEVFREVHGDFRWLVIGDDDSIFLLDNLVDVLQEYDHTKYYYLGEHSEFLKANFDFSFDEGFGGAGIVLSYPLAKALAKNAENCLFRYPNMRASDIIIMKCISDIGVSLSPHKGMHQIDFHGDISGFLSAHPQAPLISLHHFDKVNPIFPSKDRYESTIHLMKAASFDQSRMLQQTICYHRQHNWSFSIAWGYSVQLYESILPRSLLHVPIETFKPWSSSWKRLHPHYIFNTRRISNHSCEAPHEFFLESVEKASTDEIRTVYSRAYSRGLPSCSLNGNYTGDSVSRIEVFSPTTKPVEIGRCECYDIVNRVAGIEITKVKFRQCRMDEIID